jgi:outer membrane receptor protein involved in Fe transport
VKPFFPILFFYAFLIGINFPDAVFAGDSGTGEDTMLMFIGENLEVLSIASRREEGAWQAPAIARVISRRELRERGAETVSQALEKQPGFYMAEREWGSLPYLRGIPNSVLFLYDAVPLTSDVTKSLHPLDEELSLVSVKRIEIIRGPGSVLWGPDAFAGIVNVVPLNGKDIRGAEVGAFGAEPGQELGAFVNVGGTRGRWDWFASLSARRYEPDLTPNGVRRFFTGADPPVPPDRRFGRMEASDGYFLEGLGRLAYSDWLTLTARVSDNRRSFVRQNDEEGVSWLEEREAPQRLVKLELRKDIDRHSALRFMGSHVWLDVETRVIDRPFDQGEKTRYAELLYDRSLFSSSGLFTAGLSYRDKDVDDAPIWDGYLPEFLNAENTLLVPVITPEDYETQLWSLFAQYRQNVGAVDLWGGLRFDNHDSYQDHVSFNLGAAWSPRREWMVKLIYGTAYRTPFARQLLEPALPELEEIRSLNLEIAWEPDPRSQISVGGFVSRIDNHILEDPYAGLSRPNQQDIIGMEAEAQWTPRPFLDLAANLTLLKNSGPAETYAFNDFTFIRPDGTVEKSFVDVEYPYDLGADVLLNLMGTWRLSKALTLFSRLGYVAPRNLNVLTDGRFKTTEVGGFWRVDAHLSWKDALASGLDVDLSVENLLDARYEAPGTYGLVEGTPFTARLGIRMNW